MKKIGPLSLDLVVACQIFELEKNGELASFGRLVEELRGLVTRSSIPPLLATLAGWGVVNTEYGRTEKGRAGRLYYISGEAKGLVRETYETYWTKVLEHRVTEKEE